jgi:membrane peptidoglycan carboxypeptidase
MSTWRPISRPSWWQRVLPEWLHTPVRWVFWLGIAGLVAFGGFLFFYFILAMKFDLKEVAGLPEANHFYDKNGIEIDAPISGGQKLAKREDIPDFLVKALQAREDARFFEHVGVDFRGLARATVRNLKDGDFTQGASTLSMQLARNTYEIRAKSMHRKFLEIALTLRIEACYSKDEILTHYLNRIYFGSGAQGIEQAAQTYFGKPVRELDENQCAMVVGIIRGPHVFSPLRNPKGALEQRDQTLNRMVAMGLISDEKRQKLEATQIKLASENEDRAQRSYAFQAIRRELEKILETHDIRSDGLYVHTTLDLGWQQRLEIELSKAVADLENEKGWRYGTYSNHQSGSEPKYIQYAAITTETKTGGILALIGGRDFAHSRFDRTRSRRDLGSAFEPFIAAAAAERGKLVLPGKPVLTGRQIGPAEVERLAKRCGLSGPFLNTEDLFRGSVAATPLEMSIGLATLGNSGKRPDPFVIREIRDSSKKVIYKAQPRLAAALSSQAATEATTVLANRGGTRTFTGATGSERDAWTLRLGPKGSTAIWIGFDQPAAIARDARVKSLLDEFVRRLGNSE